MKLFRFDASQVAAVSEDGLAMLLSRAGTWVPPEGSRKMALEVLGDERAVELSDAEAAKLLASRGAPKPIFAEKDGSKAA